MGLFDNTEEKHDKNLQKVLKRKNIYEGIKCIVTLPDEELIIKSTGAFTKGLATASMGLVGLAATSGVSQERRQIQKFSMMQITEKGVVFKKAGKDKKDLRVPYEDIIGAEHIDGLLHDKREIFIYLLENQEIKVQINYVRGIHESRDTKLLRDHIIDIINENARGKDYEESGWGLESNQESQNPTSNDDINELERLANMYNQGLLTEEEFHAMKQKIIN